MMIAYKGFDKDLSCTSGGNRFQYQKGIVNVTDEANCRENGFHCAEDPLDCLTYYSNWNNAVYYIVAADGDIHEDGSDSKISCTRMTLIKELSMEEFIAHSLRYIYTHPFRENNRRVMKDEAKAAQGFAVVRGKNPIAKGNLGDILGFAKEELGSESISEMGLYVVDGINIKVDTWYDIRGMIVQRRGADE